MKSFADIAMPETIQKALEKLKFIETTQIQEKAIPVLMEGQDLIACSETGSGKTGAYVIPMIIQLLEDENKSALILAPTRELAQQINEFVDSVLIYEKNFQVVRLVGGSDIRKQFKKLQKRSRIVVATPGRLIDHLKRNTIQLNKTSILVLDEGDRMIDMGFAPQLQQILKHLPEERQTSFFTATLDEKVKSLANQYLKKPVKLTIGTASRPVSSIKQNVMQVELNQKDEALVNELNARQGSVIVFLKTKYRTDRMCQYLEEYGFSVDQIHGGRTQGQRNKAIRSFKEGKIRILCATDVASRGIDVPHVEHVINVDLPMADEDYVHRIGRTARNGAEGEALSFVMSQETRYWNMIARKYNILDVMLPEKAGSRGGNKSGDRFGRRDDNRRGGSFSKKRESSGGGRFSKRDDDKRGSFSRNRDDDKRGSFSEGRDESKRGSFSKRSDDDRRGSFSKNRGGDRPFAKTQDGESRESKSFYGDREKPRFSKSREDSGEKRFSKRDDDKRGSFSGKRDDEKRGSFSGKRDDEKRGSFSGKREDNKRGPFSGKRDDDKRGSFSKKRDDDRKGSFSKKRDDDRPFAKKQEGESKSFYGDREKPRFSKSREDSGEKRFSKRDSGSFPKKRDDDRKEFSEKSDSFKKRSTSVDGEGKKVSFNNKKGKTFKKSGGFKKSRAKTSTRRPEL